MEDPLEHMFHPPTRQRRYRRQDEVGTPWCITVDGQTVEDGTVTIRDRDSLEQVRVASDQIVGWIRERLA